jgi:hypothetical protein
VTTNYNADRTRNGVNGWSRQFSDTVFSAVIAANADTSVAVPKTAAVGAPTATSLNKFYALIDCTPAPANGNNDTFVALNTAAVKPAAPAAGPVLNAVSSIMIPTQGLCMLVKTGDVLHFISNGTPNIVVQFYAVQE